MRKEYGQALRRLFSNRMKERLPRFEEAKVRSAYFWPGDRAYRWAPSGALHCWVVLSPSTKGYDQFTVLLGWSKLGRYPELSMVPCTQGPSPQREEFVLDEYLTRLPYLWTNQDDWWVVKEFRPAGSVAELEASLKPISADEAKCAVIAPVDDAIARLESYGVPYLEALRVRAAEYR